MWNIVIAFLAYVNSCVFLWNTIVAATICSTYTLGILIIYQIIVCFIEFSASSLVLSYITVRNLKLAYKTLFAWIKKCKWWLTGNAQIDWYSKQVDQEE